ncbi:hypothetical protein GWI33_014257 [Rhynchophorus ferrugineus]|uniref:Uncharacterized protein n=1 Tax=Rhynchophorus ferrugineus TaxID=354439 RepID=A0A834I5F7_RHYFE|nr:hypothetical protein GWI33_014257 [Rhynchophorus ferrugineus]
MCPIGHVRGTLSASSLLQSSPNGRGGWGVEERGRGGEVLPSIMVSQISRSIVKLVTRKDEVDSSSSTPKKPKFGRHRQRTVGQNDVERTKIEVFCISYPPGRHGRRSWWRSRLDNQVKLAVTMKLWKVLARNSHVYTNGVSQVVPIVKAHKVPTIELHVCVMQCWEGIAKGMMGRVTGEGKHSNRARSVLDYEIRDALTSSTGRGKSNFPPVPWTWPAL